MWSPETRDASWKDLLGYRGSMIRANEGYTAAFPFMFLERRALGLAVARVVKSVVGHLVVPGHLLPGVARVGCGVALRIFTSLGLGLIDVRREAGLVLRENDCIVGGV